MSGHPCNDTRYPDLLFAMLTSMPAVSCFHSPENGASKYASNDLSISRLKMIPFSFIPDRNLAICLIASAYDSFELVENLAHTDVGVCDFWP